MKMPRRGFLKLLSASPLAGKAAAEQAAAQLAGVSVNVLGHRAGGAVPNSASDAAFPTHEQIGKGLRLLQNKKDVLDLIREDERASGVGYIDPDIAVYKSFSLNAKIVFQRQRNVQRRYERLTTDYPWSRLNALLRKIASPF